MTGKKTAAVFWNEVCQALIRKYGRKRHPLNYKNTYQLWVMVILSAQTNDKLINSIAPDFFKSFPDIRALSKASYETVVKYLNKVRNFGNKTRWLLQSAIQIKTDDRIPLTFEQLLKLPGIGRKSAHVIMYEHGLKPQGIMVDIHVLRVAPRLGMCKKGNPVQVERELLKAISPQYHLQIGMALSHHGRAVCLAKSPLCEQCLVQQYCNYHLNQSAPVSKKRISKS
jgi:endonuclease-3